MSTRPFTLQEGHIEVDRLWREAFKSTNTSPSCHKGCFACCAEPNIASMEEAKLIIKKIPAEKLEAVKERTALWVKKLQATGMDKMKAPPRAAYLSHRLMCPLLDNGTCMVYQHRPMGCRTFFAFGPAEKCSTDPIHQSYASNPKLDVLAAGILFCDGVKADHLTVMLHRLLFQANTRTAAADYAEQGGQAALGMKFGIAK